KRTRLKSAFNEYITSEERLISSDFIERPKLAICICKHEDHWGYFIPMRLAGYKLVPIYDDSPKSINICKQLLLDEQADAFAIFNPYMKSHAAFKPLYFLAKERGIT